MSIKKHLNFLELLHKKKENILYDFLIDEIDADSCFFFQMFLDVYVVQIEFYEKLKVFSGKLTQSKSLLLIHILRIKAINLLLSYT